MNEEINKAAKVESKLEVTTTKKRTFKYLYIDLGDKMRGEKLYKFAKSRKKNPYTWID